MKLSSLLSLLSLLAISSALPSLVTRNANPLPAEGSLERRAEEAAAEGETAFPEDIDIDAPEEAASFGVGAEAAPKPPAIPKCWKTLSCSFATIEKSSMASRLRYVRYMQAKKFGPLKAGNQFRAIEAVIDFFIKKKVGQPGTWISYVDAGIVEGIQRGAAISLGTSKATGGNPGSQLWADFFNRLKSGGLNNRNDHDNAWGIAEEAATNYGADRAKKTKGVPGPTPQQNRWFNFTKLYRLILRNRDKFRIAIYAIYIIPNPAIAFGADAMLTWLTDVTNFKAASVGLELSWTASELDLIPDSLSDLLENTKLLLGLVPKLWDIYQKNK